MVVWPDFSIPFDNVICDEYMNMYISYSINIFMNIQRVLAAQIFCITKETHTTNKENYGKTYYE